MNEVESASDDFLQRRGNDGGDQEGKEKEDKGEEVWNIHRIMISYQRNMLGLFG